MNRAVVGGLLQVFLLGQAIGTSIACTNAPNWSTPLQIEIDVYSGRPNPSFEVPESEAAELLILLRDLPRSRTDVPEPGLGYRGFVIKTPTASTQDPPARVRVFSGHVIIERGATREVYDDIHSAEAWLKKRAERAGYGALIS